MPILLIHNTYHFLSWHECTKLGMTYNYSVIVFNMRWGNFLWQISCLHTIPRFVKGKVISYSYLWYSTASSKIEKEQDAIFKMSKEISGDLCLNKFTRRNGLSHHKQTHSRVKKYNCPQYKKSFGLMGWRNTHSFTRGRNRTSAHRATSHANNLLASKRISKSTPGKNSFVAINVITKHHNQATWRSTGGHILDKKPSIAINVNTKQTIKHLEQTQKDALWWKAT